MKRPRELIEFLFKDSQPSEREMLAEDCEYFYEELETQQELEPKKTPLKTALSALGIKDAELVNDVGGFILNFSAEEDYHSTQDKLLSPDAMMKLAELGWVVADCGDTAMTGEPPKYRFRFVEITLSEPENKEKRTGRKDLEALVKSAREFSFYPKDAQPEPKRAKGGVGKIAPAKETPHAIKDSLNLDKLINRLLE